jgi:hypothetical protein
VTVWVAAGGHGGQAGQETRPAVFVQQAEVSGQAGVDQADGPVDDDVLPFAELAGDDLETEAAAHSYMEWASYTRTLSMTDMPRASDSASSRRPTADAG